MAVTFAYDVRKKGVIYQNVSKIKILRDVVMLLHLLVRKKLKT